MEDDKGTPPVEQDDTQPEAPAQEGQAPAVSGEAPTPQAGLPRRVITITTDGRKWSMNFPRDMSLFEIESILRQAYEGIQNIIKNAAQQPKQPEPAEA